MQLIPDATKTAILQPYIGVGKGLISSSASLIDLTGVAHWSDWCKGSVGFPQVNIWVSSLLSCVATVSSLGQFGAR
jgi:hypothetical protein